MGLFVGELGLYAFPLAVLHTMLIMFSFFFFPSTCDACSEVVFGNLKEEDLILFRLIEGYISL